MNFLLNHFFVVLISLVLLNQTYTQCSPGDPDADGDGICDAMDLCPNSPLNLDQNNDGICDSEVCIDYSYDDFENGTGNWIDGGTRAELDNDSDNAPSGNYSYSLRKDDPTSNITTASADFSLYSEVVITFLFRTEQYDVGDYLSVELNTGNGYQSVDTYTYGTDFNSNSTVVSGAVHIPGPFTPTTSFKFQAQANDWSEYIYIDNVTIKHCLGCDGNGDHNNNGACDCPGGPSADSDNDGIEDDCDICPQTGSNLDVDNDGVCDSEICNQLNYTNIEASNGIWLLADSYATINTNSNYVYSGSQSIRLRGKTSPTNITTSSIDLNQHTEAQLRFRFLTREFSQNKKFSVTYSTNNGNSFSIAKEFYFGSDILSNNYFYEANVLIVGPFSSQTKFRIEGENSSTSMYVYIDDIEIITCQNCNGNGDANNNGACDCTIGNPGPDSDDDGVEDDCDICPDSPLNQDSDNDGVCDAAGCSNDHFENFESGFGFWNDGGSYAYENTNATYASSGSNSTELRYNQPSSNTYSNGINLSQKIEASLSFTFRTDSYDPNDYFLLEYSTNGGSNYTESNRFNFGIEISANDVFKTETIFIQGPFSNNTVFRFRSVANGSNEKVFLDDINISSCLDCTGSPDTDGDGICDAFDDCPNSVTDDADNDGVCDDLDICFPGNDNIDNDNDNIPDACDPCVDINNNGICDDVDPDLPKKIVINEINYRSTEKVVNVDFLEIYNHDNIQIDLTGWRFSSGIHYAFPPGTTINPGEYIVIAADPINSQSEYSFSNALGPYNGNLSGKGDHLILRDHLGIIIDEVEYESWEEWPNVRYKDQLISGNTTNISVSLQKINPELDGKHPGAWDAETPTPQQKNSSVFRNNPLDVPVIKSVSKKPNNPDPGEEVKIRADFDEHFTYASNMTVTLEYQINNAGSYVSKSDAAYNNNWVSIPMLDDGMGADSTANNGLYTAVIPSIVQQHRRLIRYRVKVTTTDGFNWTYPDQRHQESNYSYFVYGDHASFNGYNVNSLNSLQEYFVLTNDNIPTTNSTGQYNTEATVVYDGEVYDHILFRGRGSTARTKPGLKFKFNSEKKLNLENDCGNNYNEVKSKLTLSGTWVGDPASHGLTESLTYKILELTGGLPRHADYFQLRIIDNSTESGNNGDFWGIYLGLEDYHTEDYFDEHDLPTGNIWSNFGQGGNIPSELSHCGDFPNAENIGNLNTSSGPYDWDRVIGDRVANIIYGQNGENYFAKHSDKRYYNSETGLWHIWWGDMDNAFGSPVDDYNTFERNQSDLDNECENALYPEDEIRYKNELRSAWDLLLNQQQRHYLVDTESSKIYDPNDPYSWALLDSIRWDQDHDLGSINAQINWYKTWFQNRVNVIQNRTTDGIMDNKIPNKPVIILTGSNAIDDLSFNTSNFTDPQGNNTFEALEWRIAEWSDPNNLYYDSKCEPKFEIQDKWRSGEITQFSNSFTFPVAANLKHDRTYKIRVRHKDNTNRWSHWSDPYQFISEEAISTPKYDIVINEIMYNPSSQCDGDDYIEIYNNENFDVIMTDYSFTEGIEYDFPAGSTISSGEYLVLAKDSTEFLNFYGFSPFGEYSGKLSNSGEDIKLEGPHEVIIDTLIYDDKLPWDTFPDGIRGSLSLLEPNIDNYLAQNWIESSENCGSPGQQNFICPSPSGELYGTSCDDLNPCTFGETIDINCNCTNGSLIDMDNDDVCDFVDSCPNLNNNLIGQSCDDGDPCTEGEYYLSDCSCGGGMIAQACIENCPETIIENSNNETNQNISAILYIESNNIINYSGGQVKYTAGEYIELLPEFEVVGGTVFHIYIDACN